MTMLTHTSYSKLNICMYIVCDMEKHILITVYYLRNHCTHAHMYKCMEALCDILACSGPSNQLITRTISRIVAKLITRMVNAHMYVHVCINYS